MARFDAYPRPDGAPGLLLDVQADLMSHLSTRVVVPLLPKLLPDVWRSKIELPSAVALPSITRPGFAVLAMLVLVGAGALVVAGMLRDAQKR